MEHVALDVARRLQHHPLAADRAHHVAPDDDLLGDDGAGDLGLLANHDVGAVDVALHLAFDMDLAARDEIADDQSRQKRPRDVDQERAVGQRHTPARGGHVDPVPQHAAQTRAEKDNEIAHQRLRRLTVATLTRNSTPAAEYGQASAETQP